VRPEKAELLKQQQPVFSRVNRLGQPVSRFVSVADAVLIAAAAVAETGEGPSFEPIVAELVKTVPRWYAPADDAESDQRNLGTNRSPAR
jgi:hypothetical protein